MKVDVLRGLPVRKAMQTRQERTRNEKLNQAGNENQTAENTSHTPKIYHTVYVISTGYRIPCLREEHGSDNEAISLQFKITSLCSLHHPSVMFLLDITQGKKLHHIFRVACDGPSSMALALRNKTVFVTTVTYSCLHGFVG